MREIDDDILNKFGSTLGDVQGCTDFVACKGQRMPGSKKNMEETEMIISSVRGNRPTSQPLTYSDLRLILIGILKKCLERLES